MSKRLRSHKKHAGESHGIALNVIPMIDMFTILNAFLLLSAAFFAFGQIQVEIPFLSSKIPPKTKNNDDSVSVNITLERDKIEVAVAHSRYTRKDKKKAFLKENGKYNFSEFHNFLVQVKQDSPSVNMYTLFPDDNIKYSLIVDLLDAARDLRADDPPLKTTGKDGSLVPANFLFKSVVIGGVIL